jgi:hypothetical protein
MHLILSLSISIPLFNKISLLCGQQPGGDEAPNEGCNSGPTGHDFRDNSPMCIKSRVSAFHTEIFFKIHYFADTTERGVWG